jgi:hypothetical protein
MRRLFSAAAMAKEAGDETDAATGSDGSMVREGLTYISG